MAERGAVEINLREQRDIESLDSQVSELNNLVAVLPQAIEKLTSELSLWTGKKVEYLPEQAQLESLENIIREALPISVRLEELKKQPLTPASADEICQLINRYFRLIVPSIPKRKNPIEHLTGKLAQMVAQPKDISLPSGLDYEKKHLGLQQFAHELVGTADRTALDAFLDEMYEDHQLVPQFQKAFNKMPLPIEFRKPLVKVTRGSVEKLKLALRSITADWEALLNLVYGLSLVEQNKQTKWTDIRKVSLGNKVKRLATDYRLNSLTKQEWVTARNALDHGSVFYDSNKDSIEFPDIKRKISWSVERTRIEGIDLYLANCAMLGAIMFIKWEQFQPFINSYFILRELSSQPSEESYSEPVSFAKAL